MYVCSRALLGAHHARQMLKQQQLTFVIWPTLQQYTKHPDSLCGGGNRSFTFLTPAPTSSVTFCQTCHDRKSLGPSHRVYHETLPLWWCVTASWKSSAVVSWAQLKLSPHWSCIWSSVLTKLPVACTGNMTHTYRRFHTFCLLSKSYISFFVILFDDTTTTT